jgi:hypothetical protein
LLLAGVALAAGFAVPGGAAGDTGRIPSSPDLPWTDPAHQSPLELLAGQVASHIAGRSVTVHCEGENDWATLVRQTGGDPSSESGYVGTAWHSVTGQLVSTSSVAELAPGVCLPLETFAMATSKPTKCSAAAMEPVSLVVKRVQVRRSVVVGGKRRVLTTWVTRRVATRAMPAEEPGACYLGNGKTARPMPASFWADYAGYSVAIVTLAHESIHLGGIVGGQLSNGLPVGDQHAEAKADCYGMQSMRYVAEQLGDTPDDAQAIANYFWDKIYPLARTSSYAEYWSADCRPGGLLDIRLPGAINWL